MKSYLKSNRYHTAKHSLSVEGVSECSNGYFLKFCFAWKYIKIIIYIFLF